MQPSAFLNQIAENIVLKSPVFLFAWNAARNVASINVLGLGASRIAERHGAEVCDFKLHRNAAAPRVVLKHTADETQVVRKRSRQFADVHLLHPAIEHLLLQGDEYSL